jgi:hypothetical protein
MMEYDDDEKIILFYEPCTETGAYWTGNVRGKKVKPSRYTPCVAWGERKYSSYLLLTSALDGGEWSASRPGRALPPGKGYIN